MRAQGELVLLFACYFVLARDVFSSQSHAQVEVRIVLDQLLDDDTLFQAVKADLARGRVYLPLEDLTAYGCTVDDLAAGTMTEPIRRVVEFECRRAREFYRRAADILPQEDRRHLVAAEIMRAVYFETLERIERSGYDVFTARARVPRPKQALIAAKQWLWA